MHIDMNIRCLATGRIIAEMSDDEVGLIVAATAHIPADKRQAHLDRLILGTMRPSIAWASVTPESIDALREAAPMETLAYLLNRLFAPVERTDKQGKAVDSDAWYNARRMRIEIWESLNSQSILPDQLDSLLLCLLELDSRFGLTKVKKPTSLTQLWFQWSEDSTSQLILELWTLRNALMAEHHKAMKRAKFQAEFWSEGNRLTRNATVTHAAKVKPPATKIASEAKRTKHADAVDFLTQLEEELTERTRAMKGAPVASVAVASVRVIKQPTAPAAPKGLRFTSFGKKGA
jgi:hypothetical protein